MLHTGALEGYSSHVNPRAGTQPLAHLPALMTRISWLALVLAMAAPATAEEKSPAAVEEKEKPFDPDAGFARPEAPDLRDGHILLSLSGGAWMPSKRLTPSIDELGVLDVGGTLRGHVGLGLGRYLVLQVDGGYAGVPSTGTSCEGCGATSLDFGATMLLHLTQGFAVDPWVGYGMAYRHTILTLDSAQEDRSLSGFDFTRLSLGGSFYPLPSLGFGPYLETDIGLRQFDDPVAYAAFHLGLRVTYDPMRTGMSFTPGVAAAR
jgi:hypothetical protein